MALNYDFKYFTVDFPSDYPHVAHVEINRADKMNAFFEAMWLELAQVFNRLSEDPAVRAIVLSGAGDRAFTTGLDVKAASEGRFASEKIDDPARKAVHWRRHIVEFQGCITSVERCEKPVIVAMHGFALGLGIDLSTAADVRICSRDVQFAVKEVDIGLAADIGTLSRLPKVVGSFGWVKELAMTARVFGAEEALRVGFVNSIHETRQDTIAAALKLAGLMGTKSPVAVQGTKEILNWSRDHSVQDGLRYTGVWNSAALQTQDIPAALLSGIQKRKPTFEKL
ncbi:Delta(3-5)-Delta(2-4)-dienoyl-CoA isomerase [Penicillium capsulatum]|uniref:Delta(3-5)-Delta(2-4)-dienoyl-CoA isomerase n=1 Tax=Penicillium capsulatum TaxID=69766 RepID=A0A9W9LLF2_9EURO|nr:Delta(3-5)-Delta(2-4)-dienoyl-CoA isomerase [Penicillium capsulatum]KAJ6116568.1 Delta(3-5)-Delta(2-4)-dienoyl-CoA isomerase [Penicillium capsulatum]